MSGKSHGAIDKTMKGGGSREGPGSSRDADGDIVQARFDVIEAVDFAPFSNFLGTGLLLRSGAVKIKFK
ncbi:MAG: hypothetical protein K6T71_04485 [Candidatus Bipolaricaulota bacterium]|nr:hypothetical protein [Candidatus Bipolaricaulota bacterium]